jgi:hypothetical protein
MFLSALEVTVGQREKLIGLIWVFIVAIFYWWNRRDRAWLKKFDCPSPALFLVGNLYEFAGHPTSKTFLQCLVHDMRILQTELTNKDYFAWVDIQSAIHKWVKEFGGIFYVWWLRAPVFIINDPDIIRVTLGIL